MNQTDVVQSDTEWQSEGSGTKERRFHSSQEATSERGLQSPTPHRTYRSQRENTTKVNGPPLLRLKMMSKAPKCSFKGTGHSCSNEAADPPGKHQREKVAGE